ncbi:hypothetical protein EC991_004476, partial [Linnemannia zychae]
MVANATMHSQRRTSRTPTSSTILLIATIVLLFSLVVVMTPTVTAAPIPAPAPFSVAQPGASLDTDKNYGNIGSNGSGD